jgi:hypothetical protein
MFFIHVLRVRCEPLLQPGLFSEPREASIVISDSLLATPTAQVGRGSEWHIGRPEVLPEYGIGFQMGRVQAVATPQFDTEEHRFFEAEALRAPYTLGIYDQQYQACGIIRKSGVSQSSSEIAGKLQRLLNATPFPETAGYRIVVDPIPDPAHFVEQIRSAERITKFSFVASFENPFDVENLIQRPAEHFNQVARGRRTKVEVDGEDLNKEVLEELARGVAATGEQAAASIRPAVGARGKRIYLKGSPVTEQIEPGDDESVFESMLRVTRDAYSRIRHSIR